MKCWWDKIQERENPEKPYLYAKDFTPMAPRFELGTLVIVVYTLANLVVGTIY